MPLTVRRFVVQQNQFALLELLLQASCRIGLSKDESGAGPLQIALLCGKRQGMQLILDAMHTSGSQPMPGSIRQVSEARAPFIRFPAASRRVAYL